MTGPGDVDAEILDKLRPIFTRLPESYEEPAWIGVRWRIRKRTIAHVLVVDPARPSAYVRAAGADEPTCLLTFRAPLDEVLGLVGGGHPFYKPDWSPTIVGMVIDGETDWDEVAELLTESYRLLAPKRLASLVP